MRLRSGFRKVLPAALLLAVVSTAIVAVPGVTAAAAGTAARVDVTWENTSSWRTGFRSAVTVANGGSTKLRGWRVLLSYESKAVVIRDARKVASTSRSFTVAGPTRRVDLAAGGRATFRVDSRKVSGAKRVPTACTVVGASVPCSVNGGPATPGTGGPTPVPTAAPVPTPSTTPTPTAGPPVADKDGSVVVGWRTVNAWPSGSQSSVTVTNRSSVRLDPWQVRFVYTARVAEIWDATATTTSDGFTATAPAWARGLDPSAATSFGLTSVSTPGGGRVPTGCSIVGLPAGRDVACTVESESDPTAGLGSAPTPTPTLTPTPTPSPTAPAPSPTEVPVPTPVAPAPVPLPAPHVGDTLVAPYVDMGLWPTADLRSSAAATGVRAFTLAFIVSDNGGSHCTPAWAGFDAYRIGGPQDFAGNIAAFQQTGGRVVVSFGGAVNEELALRCTDPAELQAAYQQVVDRFGVDRIDLDIEGAALSDTAANERRAVAVAGVVRAQAAKGRSLEVSLTLPVMPTGLTREGLAAVAGLSAAGVRIAAVNVMAMDYGTGPQRMATAAQDAATSTAAQLATVPAYAGWTAQERLSAIGITPMIGRNDTGEVFTRTDAEDLARWSVAHGIEVLAWWEVTRDQPCTPSIPTYMCSGVTDAPWTFARAFVRGATS
ncbi:cellulose binding domain-containing protein [Curtobacterium sp. MCBD17_023]|uniref:glycoside hydrolase family 18 protein n=1 Tax=Curtobacterium sp. MCBD17_023 TaxID=2175657 RepID=UPI000D8770A1|nr:cellulose binding domain-containing protein [Curtobacterium sp. MCBD17_023]PYY50975.1 hypothetical protein DEI84_04180 [Curtobacterium sp. MCBD17_023]